MAVSKSPQMQPSLKHETFELQGSKPLFAQSWQSIDAPVRGRIGIVHGLGEHSSRYHQLAEQFVAEGYSVYAYDQRGHGRTKGTRGDAPSYDTLLDDVEALLLKMDDVAPQSAKFLFGQSFGGALVLNLALRRNPKVCGVISSSPLLVPTHSPSFAKHLFARLIDKVWPTFQFHTKLDASGLSHDEQVVAAYKADQLVHDCVSARVALTMLDAGVWAMQNASGLSIPALLMHGSADPITSAPATAAFAENAPNDLTELRLFPDCYHELHWEIERDTVFETVLAWLAKHKS